MDETRGVEGGEHPPEYRWWKKAAAVAPAVEPVVRPGSTGVIISTPPSGPKLMQPLLAAIKKFPRDNPIPIAEVRKRLEAAMEDQVMTFNSRTRRNIVNRARDAAGWESKRGRHAVWTYTGVAE